VRGEFLPGRSNLNLLLSLASQDREILARYAKAQRRWSREQVVVPLLLTADEIQRSAAAFPLEFLEIQEQHRLLSGRDPFIGLHIDDTHLAAEVFQSLSANLLRVRQRFVEGGGTEEATTLLLPLSLTGLLPCLRGMQRVAGRAVSFNSDALLADMQRFTGFELPGLVDVLNLKRGKMTLRSWYSTFARRGKRVRHESRAFARQLLVQHFVGSMARDAGFAGRIPRKAARTGTAGVCE
jgi:hypothetical protein